MKKVTLLGDSIRMIGYGAKVEEELKKTASKYFNPTTIADSRSTLCVCFSIIKIKSRAAT